MALLSKKASSQRVRFIRRRIRRISGRWFLDDHLSLEMVTGSRINDAVPRYPDAESSTAFGSLVGEELFLSKLAAPEGPGCSGPTGDRVFIDSRGGSEEAGDES